MQKHEQIEQRNCLDTTQLDPMTALMLQGKNFSFRSQSVYKTGFYLIVAFGLDF